MIFLCCFILIYLAAVSQMMGAEIVCVPALVVVFAVRWFPPSMAAVWAFVLGLMLDGLGTGPLGLHAAVLVALAAVLPRLGFAAEPCSAMRWMWAVLLTALCDAAIGTGIEFLPAQRWDEFQRVLIQQSLSAGVTAVLAGVAIGVWRQLAGTPCTTH
jgi:cell shape-determining protein MreD